VRCGSHSVNDMVMLARYQQLLQVDGGGVAGGQRQGAPAMKDDLHENNMQKG